jgi:hypothetical protein
VELAPLSGGASAVAVVAGKEVGMDGPSVEGREQAATRIATMGRRLRGCMGLVRIRHRRGYAPATVRPRLIADLHDGLYASRLRFTPPGLRTPGWSTDKTSVPRCLIGPPRWGSVDSLTVAVGRLYVPDTQSGSIDPLCGSKFWSTDHSIPNPGRSIPNPDRAKSGARFEGAHGPVGVAKSARGVLRMARPCSG